MDTAGISIHAMDREEVAATDTGKRVVNYSGKKIGEIAEVTDGVAYVDPVAGLADSIRSKLGWADSSHDEYRLEPNRIAKITGDEIKLKK